MSSAVLCIVMATVTVEFGYEPMPDGNGIRYVLQIEPEMLDILGKGEPVGSTIPPEVLGRIREFRIVSRNGTLSKEIPPLAEQPPASAMPPEMPWLTQPVTEERNPDSAPNLLPDPNMVIPTSGVEESTATAGPSGTIELDDEAIEEAKAPKTDPWFLLVLASVIAVGSSSGMLIFGWLTFDYRSRYLGLLRESMETGDSWLDAATGYESVASESAGSRADSAETDNRVSNEAPAEDPAWEDIGAETRDSLDDWLREDGSQRNGSPRNRKKSR